MRFVYSVVATMVVALAFSLLSVAPAYSAEAAKGEAKPAESGPARTVAGLQVLYDFRSAEGDVVPDRSGVGEPLNLRITNPKAVRRSDGSLEVTEKTQIRSDRPAKKIAEAVRRSGEITIEAWVRPVDTGLSGPARIVTLSRDSGGRNFTLGQDGDRYDVRFLTSDTDPNGIPSLSTPKGTLEKKPTHVVYTRARNGRARLYINGQRKAETTVKGSTSRWDDANHLALADEFNADRAWKGAYYLVAIYSRDLLPREVKQHFEAGKDAAARPRELAHQQEPQPPGAQLFVDRVAPLLANHCLECHDAVTRKGGLDLSRKQPALAGGDSGPALVPGKAAESLLWEYLASDAMPAERPPLSTEEKEVLREWIDTGATWSLELIDPVVYEHHGRASENWIRRLTVPEYIETVRAAVGVDIAKEAREMLPPDVRADGFSNTAYNLSVDLKHVEAYSRLAELIAQRMDALKFASRFSKSRSLSTDDTMRDFVGAMGKWLFRGPLDEREINTYSGIATTVASAGGDFEEAVRYMVEAMLQSPRFIYRVEMQTGDGSQWPADAYEIASRMSYIIWGGPPDEDLMRAADSGELYDRHEVAEQIDRMLKDPRAVERSKVFISEWVNLGRLSNLQPNRDKFSHWNEQLARDMRQETLAFFEEVVWKQQRPLSDLLNAQVAYLTPELAKHYGVEPQGDSVTRYDLKSVSSRGGLLTQGSVLTIGGDEASMVTRGLFLLHELLRGSVKDPPPCVDTTPPPTKPGVTQRAIAEARIADVNCRGCHSKFDPLAFGLEKFDGIGGFHEVDRHGNALREDGEILFPGSAERVSYKTSRELMDLLASSERVRHSITWKLTQFALGRPLGAADAAVVEHIHRSAQEGGGTYSSTIMAIIMSDLVQMTRKGSSL